MKVVSGTNLVVTLPAGSGRITGIAAHDGKITVDTSEGLRFQVDSDRRVFLDVLSQRFTVGNA